MINFFDYEEHPIEKNGELVFSPHYRHSYCMFACHSRDKKNNYTYVINNPTVVFLYIWL